ncbi:MAG: hypothetical protein GX102_01450 [Porphyromonadaceae bacterium]|nr:hypothetical protein [Porphyromonadaceae bacterium]
MSRINHFLYGFIPGILLPILFLWIYLNRFYPTDSVFFEILKQLFPSVMMGKLLLLSIMPNLVGVFIFYKQDNFKLGIGMMLGALPYLVAAMIMM